MYPSAHVSRPHLIDYHADDTEMLLHLDKMMHGAPHPQNVLTDVDVDPYAVAPWNLPPNMLYFINSDHDISLKGENGIKATEGGYWFSKTWTQSPTMGRVTTKEFYWGKAPRGEKTVWVMKEYTMDKFLGSSSLCKVFKHNNGNDSEERQQAVADDAQGESVEAMLLRMLEHEENISGFQSLSNMSQVVSGNRHGPPLISGSHLQNLRPPNYVWVPGEDDFLEEKDLVGSASSSPSSSENTWVSSMTLNDEYFDPEALLRELTPSIQDTTNKQNVDCCRATGSASLGAHQVHFQPPPSGKSVNKQNVDCCRATGSASLGAHQVHFHPPPSGSLGGSGSTSSNNIKNPLMMKTVLAASLPSIHIGGLNHTHPPAARIKELPNKKIVGRITKLAKKYFCFM
ncbi:hypothetical protein MRB53_007484 [Persea americana]|uniref:Uncharacterized protein n=1 Tax=Persea americana TaxID=3435 RepID=A0ACC2MJB4_PERAE|nr:hypothetical protein MRB53_007484 [Persea americana]